MPRYARIDNNAPWNPKISGLNDAEFRAWVSSFCYADQFVTNGYVPGHALKVIGATPKIKAGLILKGCWEPNGDGIYVHDYLQVQRSKAEIEAAIAKAKRARASHRQPQLPLEP